MAQPTRRPCTNRWSGSSAFNHRSAEELRTHFWTHFKNYFEPVPDAFGVLTALRAAGLKTGIITNGSIAAQDAKISGLGLAPLMDVILISEREGISKPDQQSFGVRWIVWASVQALHGSWVTIRSSMCEVLPRPA